MSGFKLIDYPTEPSSKTREYLISDEQDLRKTLKLLHRRDRPRFVALISPTGDGLTIGVGRPLGCIMFGKASGDSLFLWALGNPGDRESRTEFDGGGTPTPVPLYRCLPFETVIEIVVYYFLNEKLPTYVEWDAD